MRLLVISQYFSPESFVINDLVSTLRDLGHHVVVATGKPNYPDGKIFDGYAAKGVQREIFDGDIEVIRLPIRPRGRGGAASLFLNYLSFVIAGLLRLPFLLRNREFELIIVYAPSPITQAIPAILLRLQKKAHLAIWVQDLWPESLSATGFVRNRTILAAVRMMVRWIYAQADTLLAQNEAFIAPLTRYARKDKIVCFPSALRDPETSTPHDSGVPSELTDLLKRYFCAVFAGNIGSAQAVHALTDAASDLRDAADIRMVLIGSGSMLEWVRQRKTDCRLENLILAGRFPSGAMPEILSRSGCLVVTLKDEEIYSYTIPAKLPAYLATGVPIVAALNGEGARVVVDARAGLTCAAEDGLALAQCIRSIYRMPEVARAAMGRAGRAYFLEHYEIRKQAARMIDILSTRMAGNGGRT